MQLALAGLTWGRGARRCSRTSQGATTSISQKSGLWSLGSGSGSASAATRRPGAAQPGRMGRVIAWPVEPGQWEWLSSNQARSECLVWTSRGEAEGAVRKEKGRPAKAAAALPGLQ